MSKPLLVVFIFFNILKYGSTSDADTAMIMESSKLGIQRTSPVQHAVQETSSSRFGKAGGYTSTVPKTINQPRSGRRSASCSIKPPSFFMAALNYVILGLFLITRFF
ncbi:hypothetical protein HN51_064178 [Arachis hypogaea]